MRSGTVGRLIKILWWQVMSLNTFSHTFHYVTHYTDPDIDINIPRFLHFTDTCRKLDFETGQDLRTNTRGSWDEFVVQMSWLASLTATNVTPIQQAAFVIWRKKPKWKDKRVDTIIRIIHLHSNNTSVCSVLGESQPSTVLSVSVCICVTRCARGKRRTHTHSK